MKQRISISTVTLLLVSLSTLAFCSSLATPFDSNNTQIPEDIWITRKPMPTARDWAASAVVNGMIYVIGGRDSVDHAISTVEAYDPLMDTWISKASMPTPRAGLAAVEVSGKIYAMGGWDLYIYAGFATVEVYDPESDTWSTRTPMPFPRMYFCAVAVNGIIYVIGGHTGVQLPVVAYDPSEDVWTVKNPPPTYLGLLEHSTAVAESNSIYVIYKNWTLVYDPITETWNHGTSIPSKREVTGAEYVGNGIYVFGGITVPGPLPIGIVSGYTEMFDPLSNSWVSNLTSMITPRAALIHESIDGIIYIIGGYTFDQGTIQLSSNEAYVVYSGKKQKPSAQFFASPTVIVQGTEEVSLDASSSYDSDGSIVAYWFDYGDGSNSGWSSQSMQAKTYFEFGYFKVKLKVRDNDGLVSDWSQAIEITVLPVVVQNLIVPYEAQGNAPWCWAASTAMILRYYGKPVHVWDVGKTEVVNLQLSQIEVYIHRTYPDEFETKIGRYPSISDQTRKDIEVNLSEGYPILLNVDPNGPTEPGTHNVVVTGFNSSGFFVNDPSGALVTRLESPSSYPYVHEFVKWEELEPFVFREPLFNDVFLVVKGNPAPIDATLSVINGKAGVRTTHDLNSEKGICVDYGGWYFYRGLYWSPIGWHPLVWDSRDTLSYSYDIYNHKNQEARFDFHLKIKGEDDVIYYNKTFVDVLVPAYDYRPLIEAEIPLKENLTKKQWYTVITEICNHESQEVIDSITLPPIYYSAESIMFMIECPVRILVIDPDGLRIGFDSGSNQVVNEIPDALYYSGNGVNPEMISIPNQKDGNYTVRIFGINSGSYNLTCSAIDENSSLSFLTITNKPIEKDETQTYAIPEFPSFLIMPMFLILTLLVVILERRKNIRKLEKQ